MIRLEKITFDDLKKINEIYSSSFEPSRKDVNDIKFNDSKVVASFIDRVSESFKIIIDDELVGGISLRISKDNYNFLVSFFLKPEYQKKGLGTTIWNMIEEKYPHTISWTSNCPIYLKESLVFFINKCKFKLIKIENYQKNNGTYLLEKFIKPSYR